MPAPWHAAFGATGKSFRRSPAGPRGSGPLGAERGIITKVEVDVTLERAIGVERGPATTSTSILAKPQTAMINTS
jgi:hypothetical protein